MLGAALSSPAISTTCFTTREERSARILERSSFPASRQGCITSIRRAMARRIEPTLNQHQCPSRRRFLGVEGFLEVAAGVGPAAYTSDLVLLDGQVLTGISVAQEHPGSAPEADERPVSSAALFEFYERLGRAFASQSTPKPRPALICASSWSFGHEGDRRLVGPAGPLRRGSRCASGPAQPAVPGRRTHQHVSVGLLRQRDPVALEDDLDAM